MIITSASNEQIKKLINLREKSKVRKSTGLYLVEGIKMFMEIPPQDLVDIYVSETFAKEKKELLSSYDYNIVTDALLKKISDTVTPQGIVCTVKQKKCTVDEIIEHRNAEKSCIVVLDRIQDPGNLGTIVRTAEAAGISGIVMSSGCADIYSPKVIRSTMGSVFRVPFAVSDCLVEDIKRMKKAGIITYAAHLNGTIYSKELKVKDLALLIGNEARGLSDEVSALADRMIKIPMEGKVESLNAAIATAILMYEAMK